MNNLGLVKTIKAIAIGILLLTVADIFIGIFCPRGEHQKSQSLLVSNDTLFLSASKRDVRIRFLSDIVLEHQSTYAQYAVARESERMQARLSFVGAFAFLLVALLRPNSNIRSSIVLTALALYSGFYFFDIHTVDLWDRASDRKLALDTTILVLSRVQPSDSTWYDIDYGKVEARYDSLRQHSRLRKVASFFRPDLSQIAFYSWPLSVLLGLYLGLEYFSPGLTPGPKRGRKRRRLTRRST
jgi:hypothetical protein